MKKTLILLLLLIGACFKVNAYKLTPTEQKTRDSIFHEASLTTDSLRPRYLRDAFQQNIGREYAVEYLDSALSLCLRKNFNKEELWTLFDYCRHYEYRAEIPMLEKRIAVLKDASYKYKDYMFYYTIWLSWIQSRCELGDSEYAILQSKEMRTEAIRLKYKGGVFIANLALAQAYDFSGQGNEAILTYRRALNENPRANDAALYKIHNSLYNIYEKQKKYSQALHELQLQYNAIKRISKKSGFSDNFRSAFLEIEISFCKIYIATGNKEKLSLHLENAKKYYHKNTYVGTYIDYHNLWGSYYKLNREWDKCLQELDLALAACRGLNPFGENKILKTRASALLATGHLKEAAEAYKTAAIRGDSLNRDVLERHQEAHQANYKIQQVLLEKEQLIKRNRYIQVGAAVVILILLIIAIIRASLIGKQLRISEEKTRQALETIKAADVMKERFLHNITHEIRIPLNTVVGFAEILSSGDNITEEELAEYSTVIKSNSAKLLLLINNILDLSRLEAGMMRFNVQENDAVQMCREAKMMTEMDVGKCVELTFHTELEELQINVDSKWFLKLLTSLLTVPKGYAGETRPIEYTISKENDQLKIVVKNSPLYQCWEDEQEQHILHDINRLYVEKFNGSYQVEEEKLVSITFPIG